MGDAKAAISSKERHKQRTLGGINGLRARNRDTVTDQEELEIHRRVLQKTGGVARRVESIKVAGGSPKTRYAWRTDAEVESNSEEVHSAQRPAGKQNTCGEHFDPSIPKLNMRDVSVGGTRCVPRQVSRGDHSNEVASLVAGNSYERVSGVNDDNERGGSVQCSLQKGSLKEQAKEAQLGIHGSTECATVASINGAEVGMGSDGPLRNRHQDRKTRILQQEGEDSPTVRSSR
jgi:hypothetical protein